MSKKNNVNVPDGLINDFPSGPLDQYRKKASFDWKQLQLLVNGEEILRFKNKIWDFMASNAVYAPMDRSLTLPEERLLAQQRVKTAAEAELLSDDELLDFPLKGAVMAVCFGLVDYSFTVKKAMGVEVFRTTIRSMGTVRHEKFIDAVDKGEIFGSFCLTELAHGTNARGMRTRATYDPSSKEFVINTPEPQDAKCWAGNLGQSATHGVLFAQLYTPDGQCHGLNGFVVPIRNPQTMRPYPGVTVGDMGAKAGLNGIDNGFMMFNNYRIPRENLLNRTGDVTEDGIYVSPIKDTNQRFGQSMGNLSIGRASIINMCVENLRQAITIAIRYSAVRKQFGPEGGDEIPILEYQLHQWRLIPYLAATYVLGHFGRRSATALYDHFIAIIMGNKDDIMREKGAELHALLCAGKSVTGWVARDGIQESREACGGHGYLKISGISDVRNNHDANLTYEGDNNVILQQTSNYLLGLLQAKHSGSKTTPPMGSADCIGNIEQVLRQKYKPRSVEEASRPEAITGAYQWLVCYLLHESARKLSEEIAKGKDPFCGRNDTQVYYLRTLSLAYAENTAIQWWFDYIRSEEVPKSLEPIMYKLGTLYGLWSLDKHLTTLYQGAYFVNPASALYIRQGIVSLCEALKDDAVALVDVIAPPDHVLNSALGKSDGQLYKNLLSALIHSPGAMERPAHWKELVDRPVLNSVPLSLPAKL